MTSLPPRPGSPPKRENDRPDSRYGSDDRDRRVPRYQSDRDERFSRTRSSDLYTGDNRRDSDSRRRDYGDRDRDRDRDRDWDRGGWDRSRDFRDRDRGSRYSPPPRDRYRGPPRERSPERSGGRYTSPDRYRDSYKYSPRRDRSPPRRENYRRSRSPLPRKRHDSLPYRGRGSPPPRERSPPPPRDRSLPPRDRSPPPPRDRSPPPPKRLRLGDHSIDLSPPRPTDSAKQTLDRSPPRRPRERTRSPPRRPTERNRSPPRRPAEKSHFSPRRQKEKSRSPRRLRSKSPVRVKREQTPPRQAIKTEGRERQWSPPKVVEAALAKLPTSPAPRQQLEIKPSVPQPTPAPLPPREPLADRRVEVKQEPKREADDKMDVDVKPEIVPTAPRPVPVAPRQSAPLHPRSPPKGPRNHTKGNMTPTGPAYHHPPGPQGQRRPPMAAAAPPPSAPSAPAAFTASIDAQPTPAPPGFDPKIPLPTLPTWDTKPSLTRELDVEVARLQAHRAHLATEYSAISKSTRRAMHELDVAVVDLRAAEARRRIAENQMGKARAGILGIDALAIEPSIT